jgi:hypothetical protein
VRPADLQELLPTLEGLATHGGARPRHDHAVWLRSVGAAVPSSETDWAVPTLSWIESAVPARDRVDILRRTAIRDPGYRAHLDLVLASVLHAVGRAERWRRFDELVQGPLLTFAPRFVQLLEWIEGQRGIGCQKLEGSIWLEADSHIAGSESQPFALWDQALWGASRSMSILFPLLQELYVPLLAHPVHFCLEVLRFKPETEALLKAVANAARRAEGTLILPSHNNAVDELLRLGVPLRVQPIGTQAQSIASLVGPVSVSSRFGSSAAESMTSLHVRAGVPEHAVRCTVGDFERQALESCRLFWENVDHNGPGPIAFLSVSDQLGSWPEESEIAPPWAQLPGAQTLRSTARSRRDSPDADDALQRLANHLFFGFLLQVLLVESLDRELGEETLVLAPPIDRRVEDIDGATRVFYRPRRSAVDSSSGGRPEGHDLGLVDSALSDLARALGLRGVSHAYQGNCVGPWSRALRLLRSAGLIVGLYDRWSIAPHVLDRLHGGGMMTAVIRRGRAYRERLHSELFRVWAAKRDASLGLEVQHG